MEVLEREPDELDLALLVRQCVAQDVGLGRPDGRMTRLLPEPVQGPKPRGTEQREGVSEAVVRRLGRALLPSLAFAEEPLELLGRGWRNGGRELLAGSMAELPDGPAERFRHEHPDGPPRQRMEQLGVAEEE